MCDCMTVTVSLRCSQIPDLSKTVTISKVQGMMGIAQLVLALRHRIMSQPKKSACWSGPILWILARAKNTSIHQIFI